MRSTVSAFLLPLFLMACIADGEQKQMDNQAYLQDLVSTWQRFIDGNNWCDLIDGCAPIITGCGTVYELANFLNRPNECFAIVDMRQIVLAEPHYHPDDDIEIYFVLQGSAMVVVGRQEWRVQTGDVVIIPPRMAHFTIPDKEYVIAVVNTPPYKPENYIVLKESNETVAFDKTQLQRLMGQNS